MTISIDITLDVRVCGSVDELRVCGFIVPGDAISSKLLDTVDNDGCAITFLPDNRLYLSMSLDCARRRYPWFGRAE